MDLVAKIKIIIGKSSGRKFLKSSRLVGFLKLFTAMEHSWALGQRHNQKIKSSHLQNSWEKSHEGENFPKSCSSSSLGLVVGFRCSSSGKSRRRPAGPRPLRRGPTRGPVGPTGRAPRRRTPPLSGGACFCVPPPSGGARRPPAPPVVCVAPPPEPL